MATVYRRVFHDKTFRDRTKMKTTIFSSFMQSYVVDNRATDKYALTIIKMNNNYYKVNNFWNLKNEKENFLT